MIIEKGIDKAFTLIKCFLVIFINENLVINLQFAQQNVNVNIPIAEKQKEHLKKLGCTSVSLLGCTENNSYRIKKVLFYSTLYIIKQLTKCSLFNAFLILFIIIIIIIWFTIVRPGSSKCEDWVMVLKINIKCLNLFFKPNSLSCMLTLDEYEFKVSLGVCAAFVQYKFNEILNYVIIYFYLHVHVFYMDIRWPVWGMHNY